MMRSTTQYLLVDSSAGPGDERCPRLVDQDRVDLVDDGVVVPALYTVLEAECHVVPQVVEAELVVGAVGDVRVVRPAPLSRGHLGQNGADVHAQEMVDTSHPL
jgi:ribulose 1,5-bisphosphate synthetase/thiazole synthase